MATEIKPLSKGKATMVIKDYTGEDVELSIEGAVSNLDIGIGVGPLGSDGAPAVDRECSFEFWEVDPEDECGGVDRLVPSDKPFSSWQLIYPISPPRCTVTLAIASHKAKNRWGVFRGDSLLCSRRRKGNAERIARACGGRVVECNGRIQTVEYRDVEVSFTLGERDEQS